MRKDIYCELSFLLTCVSKLEGNSPSNFESHDEYEMWNAIYHTLYSSSIRLHLDLERDSFDKEINDIDKERKKAARKGRDYVMSLREQVLWDIDLRQRNQELHLILSEPNPLTDCFHLGLCRHYNGIYFTSADKDTCQKVMDEYGLLVLCPDNIKDYNHIINDEGIAIHKDDLNGWDAILRNKILPCNAMIIVDNYILNDTKLERENLTKIINALEPLVQKMSVPFHVSILTSLRTDQDKDLPVDERWSILKDITEGKNIQVSILKCQAAFHDRTILTNNLFVGCGGGFNLFKDNQSSKTTTINIVCPFLNPHIKWALKGYSNVIEDASGIYNKKDLPSYGGNISYSFPNFVVGDRDNRLLKLE